MKIPKIKITFTDGEPEVKQGTATLQPEPIGPSPGPINVLVYAPEEDHSLMAPDGGAVALAKCWVNIAGKWYYVNC